MYSPKVTISFPVYNSERYIEESLRSVLNQDYSNIELLIIDDYGTDNSMRIVHRLMNNSTRQFEIISFGENKRQGFGRNYSINNAKGKYLFFMDSDDLLALNTISTLVKYAENNNSDVVIGSYSKIDENGNEKGFIYNESINLTGQFCLFEAMYKDGLLISSYMWNKLYNLSFLKEKDISCIHPYIEDDLFSFKVLFRCNKASLVSEITYFYNTENLNSTTLVSMNSNNMSLETGRIHAEIIAEKYIMIKNLSDSPSKNKLLISTIGTGIFHLFSIKNSNEILKRDKSRMTRLILNNMPNIKLNLLKNNNISTLKIIYYSLLTKLPFILKKVLIVIFNDTFYNLTQDNSLN